MVIRLLSSYFSIGYSGSFPYNLVVIPDWSWEEVSVVSTWMSITIFFLLLSIKFIGLTLVNRIIYVSRAHFCDTWYVHCNACPPPKVKPSSVTIYLAHFILPPHHLLPSGNYSTVVGVYVFQIYIPQISEIIWFLAFPDWPVLLNIIFSMLSQKAVLHLFLRLNSIPLYIYSTFSSFNPVLKGTFVVSMSWLL